MAPSTKRTTADNSTASSNQKKACSRDTWTNAKDDNSGAEFLKESEFLAPILATFLDMRSLARFALTNKDHRFLRCREILRRRSKIEDFERHVEDLIGSKGNEKLENYARATVLKANSLCDEAKSFVSCDDGGIEDPLLVVERSKFDVKVRPYSALGMLPPCFYIPRDGVPRPPPCEEDLTHMKKAVLRIYLGAGGLDAFLILAKPMATSVSNARELLEVFRAAARAFCFLLPRTRTSPFEAILAFPIFMLTVSPSTPSRFLRE
jgi:hypothetical protein